MEALASESTSQEFPKERLLSFLTLGMSDAIKNLKGINDFSQNIGDPVERLALASWEQRYNVQLPADIKSFYQTCDGFSLSWSYSESEEEKCGGSLGIIKGKMHINNITSLRRIAGMREGSCTDGPTLIDLDSDSDDETGPSQPKFSIRNKVFELDRALKGGHVCLVYSQQNVATKKLEDPKDWSFAAPNVWFLDRALDWYFIAPNFTSYLRLMVANMGLAHWHHKYTPVGLTPQAQGHFALFAPVFLTTDTSQTDTKHTTI